MLTEITTPEFGDSVLPASAFLLIREEKQRNGGRVEVGGGGWGGGGGGNAPAEAKRNEQIKK